MYLCVGQRERESILHFPLTLAMFAPGKELFAVITALVSLPLLPLQIEQGGGGGPVGVILARE